MTAIGVVVKSIREFKKTYAYYPDMFYNEDSIKAYLAHLILKNGKGKLLVGTEVKTTERYLNRKGAKRLDSGKGHRGKFDLVIVKSDKDKNFTKMLSKSSKIIAIEIKVDASRLELVRNDARKLVNKGNKIWKGFQVVIAQEHFCKKITDAPLISKRYVNQPKIFCVPKK